MISKERLELTQRYIAALDEVGIHSEVDKENRTVRTAIERWNFYHRLPYSNFHFSIYSKVLEAYKLMGYEIDTRPKIL
jgi:hypothetical protein